MTSLPSLAVAILSISGNNFSAQAKSLQAHIWSANFVMALTSSTPQAARGRVKRPATNREVREKARGSERCIAG